MILRIHPTGTRRPPIIPAPKQRPWLEQLAGGHGYRCLPLTMGSMHGWQILCDHLVTAQWRGGDAAGDIVVNDQPLAESHFGHGILTFFPGYLFRLPKGWDLYVTGPSNAPSLATPLSAVVECDHGFHTFSMNWRLAAGHGICWERGTPFCQFWPVRRDGLDRWHLRVDPLSDHDREGWEAWSQGRMRHLAATDTDWDKRYYKTAARKRMTLRAPTVTEPPAGS